MTFPHLLLGRIWWAVVPLGGSAGCASALESSSGRRLLVIGRRLLVIVGVIAWRLRGMPTGPKVFLALPDACELRPCERTHLKNGLVPLSCVGGTYDK